MIVQVRWRADSSFNQALLVTLFVMMPSQPVLLLPTLLLLPLHGISMEETVHNLNIMLIVSFGQSGFNSSGVVPAADIALEDINNDPGVLSGYNLVYDKVRDSQVSSIRFYFIY